MQRNGGSASIPQNSRKAAVMVVHEQISDNEGGNMSPANCY